jgi:hypothetical protein
MKNQWYIKLPTGRELGPLSELQCKNSLKKLPTLEGCWVRQGSSTWKNALEVREIFDHLDNHGFYIRRDKKIFGPYTNAKLKELIDQGLKDIEIRVGKNSQWLTLEYFLNFSKSVFQHSQTEETEAVANHALTSSISYNPQNQGISILGSISCHQCKSTFLLVHQRDLTVCPYCAASLSDCPVLPNSSATPQYLSPIEVDENEVLYTFYQWLSEGEFTPEDIIPKHRIQNLSPVLIPVWRFDASYRGNWNASSGYRKEVSNLEHVGTGEHRRLATVTRTEVDWRPASGTFSGSCEVDCCSVTDFPGLDEIATFISGCATATTKITRINESFIKERRVIALPFNDDHKTVLSDRGMPSIRSSIGVDVRATIPGDTHKDANWNLSSIRVDKQSIYIPIWILRYQYGNKAYRVLIDGYDSGRLRGNKPTDKNLTSVEDIAMKPARYGCLTLVISFILLLVLIAMFEGRVPEGKERSGPSGIVCFMMIFFLISLVVFPILLIRGNMQKNSILKKAQQRRKNSLSQLLSKMSRPNRQRSHFVDDQPKTESKDLATGKKAVAVVATLLSLYCGIYANKYGLPTKNRRIR